MYDALEVAQWILSECKRHGVHMTHMKLQKLLYYAQSYFVGMTGERLFPNTLEAWEHGPVIPDVYSKYRKYGSEIINDIDEVTIPEEILGVIRAVIRDKGHFSAYELSARTHEEQAWLKAWDNVSEKTITRKMLDENFTPNFWCSDEEDDYQPEFSTLEEEQEYLRSSLSKEELDAILK